MKPEIHAAMYHEVLREIESLKGEINDLKRVRRYHIEQRVSAGTPPEEIAESCMSLRVSDRGGYVELVLDTATARTLRPIPNERGLDVGLLIDCDTERIVGIHLPLMRRTKLSVCSDIPVEFEQSDKEPCQQPELDLDTPAPQSL